MDKEEEELQFLGFLGVWKESFQVIHKYREIFIRLGLALTLPLSFIYLAHIEIIHLLMQNTLAVSILHNEAVKSRKMAYNLLIELLYITFLFVFSLLSTSAIVYTVACIHTGKKVGFKDVMRVIPKVWKRLMVTLLSAMLIMFVYTLLFIFVVNILFQTFPIDFDNLYEMMILGVIGIAITIAYLTGSFYMTVIWQLANIISVLEECYGFQALQKSKILMKGKMGISIGILFVSNICTSAVLQVYNRFVVQSDNVILGRIGVGMIVLFTLCALLLLGLVVQTVFYLVCKSYHHEQIDKTALADHLEIYHGEGYVLLKSKDIQLMEQV